jgi:hypothetical protein
LVRDGDGIGAPCWECGTRVTFSTMICDRKKPGKHGGRYQLSNLRVHCRGCSETQGARMAIESRRWKEWDRRGLRRSRTSPGGVRFEQTWFICLAGKPVGFVAWWEPGRVWVAAHAGGVPLLTWPYLAAEGHHLEFKTMRAALYALLVECTTTPRRNAA